MGVYFGLFGIIVLLFKDKNVRTISPNILIFKKVMNILSCTANSCSY